jgi:hypothetical protein
VAVMAIPTNRSIYNGAERPGDLSLILERVEL